MRRLDLKNLLKRLFQLFDPKCSVNTTLVFDIGRLLCSYSLRIRVDFFGVHTFTPCVDLRLRKTVSREAYAFELNFLTVV